MFTRHNIKDFLIITGGTAIVAAAVYFFMLPSHVSVGSATALAMVLSNFIPLPVSVITFIMNVVLLILGFLLMMPSRAMLMMPLRSENIPPSATSIRTTV